MTQETEDIVFFTMPDGSKVTNHPSYDLAKQRQDVLNSVPNRGAMGPSTPEQEAQVIATSPADLNSGQPGVGQNAVPEDVVESLHGPLGSPAMQRQTEDVEKAQAAGGSPNSTSVKEPEPVDSNERVKQVREDLAAAQEKLAKSTDKLADKGKEEGDPNTPYDEWEGIQLQHEVNKRNADPTRAPEDVISLEGVSKKSEVAALLNADDERQKTQNTGGADQA